MAASLSKRQYLTYIILILLTGAALGSVSVVYPFGRDQGIYAYAGKLLLEGKIDYRYVFDVKPPGVHFVFALSQLVLGTSMLSARLFDILWQSATALIIFLVTFKAASSKAASFLSAFLYLFLYFRLDYWHTLQADGFLNLPLALSVLILMNLQTGISNSKLFSSGLFFGLVILFKYTMIIFLAGILLIFLFSGESTPKQRLKDIAYYIGGFVFINLIVAGLYYFTGAISEFLDIQLVQTPFYARIGYETESVGFIIANIIRLFFGSVYSPLILFSIIVFVYLLARRQMDTGMILVETWALSSIIGLIIQWKFFYYHFLVIIPPLAINAGMFFVKLKDVLKRRLVLTGSIALILIAFCIFAFKPYEENYSDLMSFVSGRSSLEEMYVKKGFTSDSAFMIGRTFKAVDYVTSNTGENDYIYVWGFDPLIYYLSGRHCVSRFIYDFPLYWKGGNVKFRQEFMQSLTENNPKLILISQRDPLYYISGYEADSKLMLKKFPEFNEFIESRYSYQTQIDNFYFYRLND